MADNLNPKMPSAPCPMPKKERRFPRKLNLNRWIFQKTLDFTGLSLDTQKPGVWTSEVLDKGALPYGTAMQR